MPATAPTPVHSGPMRAAESEDRAIRAAHLRLREHGVAVQVTERQCRDCYGWTRGTGVTACEHCESADLGPEQVTTRYELPGRAE